ncbi:MAG: hypothetical protein Q9203_004552 [Teloschistes exilis]
MSSTSHQERTAAEQREANLHQVKLSQINQVNDTIRLLRLSIPPAKQVEACIRQAGGFTITSTPLDATYRSHEPGYLELAIQKSPNNPPAAWLWRPEKEILGSDILIRVGGSFVWPPPRVDPASIKRLVFVAGGVGVNPLMSILSHLHKTTNQLPEHLEFLYTTHLPPSGNLHTILFVDRIHKLFQQNLNHHNHKKFKLFLTQASRDEEPPSLSWPASTEGSRQTFRRRISHGDLLDAIGHPSGRGGTVVYVCGPPGMTDEFVGVLRGAEGMEEGRVLCEKWW